MNRLVCISLVPLLISTGATVLGYSNPVEGGDLQTVTNGWNVSMPWMMVGSNSSSNKMAVIDGGQVNNQIGMIGANAGADHNEVSVIGSDASWNNAMELSVGDLGQSNRLEIVGGSVHAPKTYIGNRSSGNAVLVSGSGGTLVSDSLMVGRQGSSNSLVVGSSAVVETSDASIGYWIGADNNRAQVSGEGSIWTNSGAMNVGEYGSGNRLDVLDGGRVVTPVLNVGAESLSLNNVVSVSGEGAVLDAPELNIGGSVNRAEVQSGGTINTRDISIQSGGNLDLNDGGLLAIDNDFDASVEGFSFNDGGALEVHGELVGMGDTLNDGRTLMLTGAEGYWHLTNNLSVESSSSLRVTDGGLVLVGNVDTNNLPEFYVPPEFSDPSVPAPSGIAVGDASGGPELIAANGSYVESGYLYIGVSSNETGSVSVMGDGSVLNVGTLTIGEKGSNNDLLITDGGRVDSYSWSWIGGALGSTNNHVMVTGTHSVLNTAAVMMGNGGGGNTLRIEDGGRVETKTEDWIGLASDHNRVEVSGAGSVWSNSGEIIVGFQGDHNQLTVSNGGRVETVVGRIGNWDAVAVHAASNSVLVTGEGSVMQNRKALYIGSAVDCPDWMPSGIGNSLSVENGGLVIVGNVDTNNLSGIDGGLVVGDASGQAELVAANGSFIDVDSAYIGLGSNERGSVMLSGGSQMEADELYIGFDGAGNSLTLQDGGRVESAAGYIGYGQYASGNRVLVSGSNSAWAVHSGYRVDAGSYDLPPIPGGTNYYTDPVGSFNAESGDLFVGYNGSDNLLMVSDGAAVHSENGYVGYGISADRNQALLSNGLWFAEDRMVVGEEGSGNQLSVTAGGGAVSKGLVVGSGTNSVGNQVLISGAGSVFDSTLAVVGGFGMEAPLVTSSNSIPPVHWEADDYSTYVGFNGSDNHLRIEDGGHMVSIDTSIGNSSLASGNSAVVTGAGSVWTNYDSMYIGHSGSGNALQILDSGEVHTSHGGVVGGSAGADYNAVVVSGEDARWELAVDPPSSSTFNNSTNYYRESSAYLEDIPVVDKADYPYLQDALVIGYMGNSNVLSIADGGRVEAARSYIGYEVNAIGNQAVVSGRTSSWNNSGDLSVGYNGSGNSLLIEDGGHVYARRGTTIGYGAAANNNSLTVSGQYSSLSVGWTDFTTIAPPLFVTNFPPIWIPYPTNLVPIITDGGSVWAGGGNLMVGSMTNNFLSITNGSSIVGGEGGSISSGNQIVVSGGDSFGGNGSVIDIATNGLWVGSAAAGQGLELNTKETIVGGTFSNSASIVGSYVTNNPVFVLGTNSMWQLNTNLYVSYPGLIQMDMGIMTVGHEGSFNTLNIENGGLVESSQGIIGERSNAWYNTVSVAGTNSQWRIRNDLSLGGRMSSSYYMTPEGWKNYWVDGGRYNSLYVHDGGLVDVGRNLYNRNYSSVTIDPGSRINVASNYYQDATSFLRFGVETNAAGNPMNALVSVGGSASFEADAKIDYAYNVSELQFDHFYTNRLVEAGQLEIGGKIEADSLDLQQLDASGSLVDVILWEKDQDIYALAGRRWLADVAGFGSNTMLRAISKSIDDLSLIGNEDAVGLINLLNVMKDGQVAEQIEQEFAFGAASYRHGDSLAEGMGLVKKRGVRNSENAESPTGVSGPHQADQGIQGWMKPYGSWADYSANGGFSGYDHTVYGTVVGVDRSFGSILFGLAGGYGQSDIQQDNGDSSRAKTGYGTAYLNWGTESWFSQLNVAYGLSQIEDQSGTVSGNRSEYDAANTALYLGGGRQIAFKEHRILFTPELSVLWNQYAQDGYTDALRTVGEYDYNSVLGSAGASLAFRKAYERITVTPEARLFWLHEFNADPDQVGYRMPDGSQFHYLMPSAEENVLKAGLGLSCLFRDQFELVIDVDGRFGADYAAYSVSGRAVFEF